MAEFDTNQEYDTEMQDSRKKERTRGRQTRKRKKISNRNGMTGSSRWDRSL